MMQNLKRRETTLLILLLILNQVKRSHFYKGTMECKAKIYDIIMKKKKKSFLKYKNPSTMYNNAVDNERKR